jgi:hypothetical protein
MNYKRKDAMGNSWNMKEETLGPVNNRHIERPRIRNTLIRDAKGHLAIVPMIDKCNFFSVKCVKWSSATLYFINPFRYDIGISEGR